MFTIATLVRDFTDTRKQAIIVSLITVTADPGTSKVTLFGPAIPTTPGNVETIEVRALSII